MASSLSLSSKRSRSAVSFYSEFLPPLPLQKKNSVNLNYTNNRSYKSLCISASLKVVRDQSLDRHVVKHNKIRFVQKLKTLLLSKPKHYMPLHILSKCRSYLSLSKPRSLLSMIHRYPSIFELFTIPTPPTPLNATKPYSQLCVRLTPAAAALATQESHLRSTMSVALARKLQKLLMLSSHHRVVLSKLVHLAPDLGLPPNFRSKLCNYHPEKFKIVHTSYGPALELVAWDPLLANPLPAPEAKSGLIVDRPLKFKHLRLRKGINVKRSHRHFLIMFGELPEVCPYKTRTVELAKESIEAEKRACAVVREVLAMMVEKRTLVDHLTHFRKELGLPNKLRGMLVRHPELFYVSLKGQRDSVLLVEGYDDAGELIEKDEFFIIKDRLLELVREGKRMRRERRRNESVGNDGNDIDNEDDCLGDDVYEDDDDDYEDLDDLFESEDSDGADLGCDYERVELLDPEGKPKFWTAEVANTVNFRGYKEDLQPW
ncbi:protein WHAT'S THIS FACTOR 1, chloroplastic isoform X1 [Diospyros lotus]|uniref:protein WHAT'S THIS FACTOR 1, chloroplastic isoform X1 n=1 Tax=Diospyros lotus TaxID=55363 RepID=UPI0022564A6E|nr:protein WHAT'S THIS FACTOR 1, chloroplastic isoform X1 [Diospyros lotus]XP_052207124.1 protein WHAT'S THIS FACTOR 1, chloroplastic isoform X1 [Diospyros lotus]XP_052207132.1 protein WHAT'S THIS FACTOR 1, chloroplastic isoform X1 [Diospyros lotus]XP_052207142.1 protein WHAT'S THIS FACTOR 1, chloroplastic isoform X1 [Diospyros lotus]